MTRSRLSRRTVRGWTALAAVVAWLGAAAAHAAVTMVTILSPSNSRNISFQVYTPPGYAAGGSQRYPSVYSLHGEGGTSAQRAATYAPTLDTAISSGQISPSIWVFPDGQNDSFYGDSFDGVRRAHTNIIGEVLPYVDAHYRTIADRDERAVEGFSMGGFGASLYAAKHPELFSVVVEYAGALAQWDDLVQFQPQVAEGMYNDIEANWLPYSAWDVTESNAAAVKSLVDYKMIVGDADGQYYSNIRFRDFVASLGIDPHFEVLPGVSHIGGTYLKEGSGLAFLQQHFANPPTTTGDFDGDLDADGTDLLKWQRQLGRKGSTAADGNGDGAVDAIDLVLWRGDFGRTNLTSATTSSAGVPEPATQVLALLAAAIGAAMSRRRYRTRQRNWMTPPLPFSSGS